MHYCFLTLGKLLECRSVELGWKLGERGEQLTYILDDNEFNRTKLKLHPSARVEFVGPGRLSQHGQRRRLLKQIRPDLVHILDPSPKTYLAVLGRRRPRVVCDWDEWPSKRFGYSLWRQGLERYLDWRMRRRSWVRVVASRFLEAEFRRYGYDSVYIPYAPRFPQEPDGPSPFARPTFVFMGNLHVAYDHDLIFHAALILKRRGVEPAIHVTGRGPELEQWRAFVRAHALDNVVLVGHLPDEQVWPHLRHAHALLFPIRPTVLNLARCPLKVYDYMQARRPILTNRVGEVMEALRERGVYADPTAESWADLIERVAAAPRSPDVDYGVDKTLWGERADVLRAAVAARAQQDPQ